LHSRVAAIILAAGKSSRFGTPKQLEKLGRQTLLERTLRTVARSKVDRVILVLGHRAKSIIARTNLDRAQTVINKRYDTGLSSSLRAGLRAATPGADAVLVVLADQPFLSTSTINRIIAAYWRTGRPIVAPLFNHNQGNPVLFDRSLFDELSRISGDLGAKSVIKKHEGAVLGLEIRDPKHFIDVDTREDLERVTSILRNKTTTRTRPRNRATDAPKHGRPS
jgi:molybdenum cofactor cytidylyltransferase